MKGNNESAMTAKDKLLFSLAKSRHYSISGKSLQILKELNIKYPNSYSIMKELGKKYFELNDYENATKYFFLVFLRTKAIDDVLNVIISSLNSEMFNLFFCGIEIHKSITIKKEELTDSTLSASTQELCRVENFNQFYNNCNLGALTASFRSKEYNINLNIDFLEKIIKIFRNKLLKVDYKNFLSVGYKFNFQHLYSENDKCEYFSLYNQCIHSINTKKGIKNILEILQSMFKTTSNHDTVEYLVQHEYCEILFYLSNKYLFFEKYFIQVQKKIDYELFNTFRMVLLTCSEREIFDFTKYLADR